MQRLLQGVTNGHDTRLRRLPVCGLCDAYADGYTAGRQKSFDELRAVPSSGHSQDCGCRPCSAVRHMKYGRMFADSQRQQRPAEPAHLQDTEEAESI